MMAEGDIRQSLGGGTPQTVGRYRVTGRLGKGSMGVVYSAHDDQLGRDVAIKVMMADLQQEPDTRARFYREAQITSQLLHRNIITVFDFGQEEGRLYLVMELLKGNTLADALKQPDHGEIEEKIDLMLQMCEGLAAAHAKGVVHRDIKPGNLFIQQDGTLKILDFGVARVASSSMTASGLILGTPDYMSPEQACGKTVDARSDVFSAAAVFYFMLTGRKPFEAPELPSVLQKVLREDAPPISEQDAPPELIRIVMRGLEKDPAQRYQHFPEMAADLIRFKRQFDADTRETVAAAREKVSVVGGLVAEIEDLRAGLGLPVDGGFGAIDGRIRERYPFLSRGPGESGLIVPVRRSQIRGMPEDLDNLLTALTNAAERLRAGEAAVQRGEQALQAGDPTTALAQFESAAGAIREPSTRIESWVNAARKSISDQRELEERRDRMLAECRTAERAGDWPTVLQTGEQLLQIAPQLPAALALVSAARAQMAAAAAARAKSAADLVEAASRRISEQHFDEAERLLDEAFKLDPAAPALDAAKSRLLEAREAVRAREAEARAEREAIALARSTSDRRAAIEQIEAFVREHPQAAAAAGELQRLRVEAAAEQRRLDAATAAAQAQAAWNRDAFDEALRQAEAAIGLDPSNEIAVQVRQRVRARLKEQAEAAARAEQAKRHVDRARQLLAAHNPEKALRETQRALQIDPGRADAVAVLEEAHLQQAAAETARKQAEAAARSAKARAQVEHGVQLATAGKLDKAERELRRALEIEPGRSDAAAALEDLRRQREMRAQKAQPAPAPSTAPPTVSPRDGVAAPAPAAARVAAARRAPRRVVLIGGIPLLVVGLLAIVLVMPRFLSPAGAPPQGAIQPGSHEAQPDQPPATGADTAKPPASAAVPAGGEVAAPAAPSAAPSADSSTAAAAGQPGGAETAATPGREPIARRRPNESLADWHARDREIALRYARAKTAFDGGAFEKAVGDLRSIETESPGYLDVPQLLQRARAELGAVSRQAMEAGAAAERAKDWLTAMRQYQRAAQMDPSLATSVAQRNERVRQLMREDGAAAFKEARVYDAVGKLPQAIAAYDRAAKYLPADDPNAQLARERAAALRRR